MTTSSRHFGTALWVAHFAGDWLPSRYTTRGDTTLLNATLDVDDAYVASLFYNWHVSKILKSNFYFSPLDKCIPSSCKLATFDIIVAEA